jgi:hypothetical protein
MQSRKIQSIVRRQAWATARAVGMVDPPMHARVNYFALGTATPVRTQLH